jgi:hypothetical protein
MYKLFDWIDSDKINWYNLSLNINAIDILGVYKINWNNLSSNINAQECIEFA